MTRGRRDLPAPPGKESFLLFRAGSQEFALPSGTIRHLVEAPKPFPLDSGPDWFAGLLHLPEGSVPALDLRRYLHLPFDRQAGAAIALRLPGASADFGPVALLVDRLLVTEMIPLKDLRPLRPVRGQLPFRGICAHTWRGRSRPCYLLDPAKLLTNGELAPLRMWVGALL
ncbi:MAG: chemotaxis protein CheW [Bryobacterales bacterium]|nr:chemotaxis protein CheW [Bryobacterales bacterium]